MGARVQQVLWIALVLVAIAGGSAGCVGSLRSVNEPIETAAGVARLATDDASQGRRALLRGVVTYANARTGRFVLQDETGGCFVQTSAPDGVETGHEVEVEGVTEGERPSNVVVSV